MNAVRPRLITFDVTGTLLLTKVVEPYESIGLQHGIAIDRTKLAPSFKRSYKQLTKDHPIYGKHTGLGWQNWWKTLVYDVFKDQDLRISQRTLDKIATGLIQNYGTSECWHKYPGTDDVLQHLKKHRNVTLGVISNFDERLESILLDTQIRPYFNFVITSYGLGIEKPDPRIFEEALTLTKKKCGLDILPHQAIHIGDTVDYDYFGAKTAGWDAILINHDKKKIDHDKVPKENVVENLEELKEKLSLILEKLNV